MKKTGLILSGGGARAAYQVGVLKAINRILPKNSPIPIDIISGTSAGAINGVALATFADNYRLGIRHLERIWANFECSQVYRTDFWGVSLSLARLVRSLVIGRRFKNDVVSVLDNAPLQKLLSEVIHFDRIQNNIDSNFLHALAINCSGIDSGESVSFFQGHHSLENWARPRRIGVRSRLTLSHLMASSAIPMVFPAVKIHREYYADGAIRQLAPVSPALHLGAEKVLVIGVSDRPNSIRKESTSPIYPSPARVMGHMLNAAFIDSLEADVERLRRINRTLDRIPESVQRKEKMELKKIQILDIAPSMSLDALAGQHAEEMPKALKLALGGSGNASHSGSGLLSYLLFSKGYCRALIELGYHDAITRSDELLEFFRQETEVTQEQSSLASNE